jgi:hypothetical protein
MRPRFDSQNAPTVLNGTNEYEYVLVGTFHGGSSPDGARRKFLAEALEEQQHLFVRAAMSELKLITPRRNFLVRALGFTAAGVTLPIGIVAADDPRARIAHHQAELEKAWRDYYGAAAVRTYADVRTPGANYTSSWSAQVRATIPCGRWKATRGSASSQTPDLARSRHARRFTPGGFLFGPIVTSRFA